MSIMLKQRRRLHHLETANSSKNIERPSDVDRGAGANDMSADALPRHRHLGSLVQLSLS